MSRLAAAVCLFAVLVASTAAQAAAPGASHDPPVAALDPADLAPDPLLVALAAETSASTVPITATAYPDGYGTIVPSGTVQVPVGTDQTFTIVPNACYYVRDVVVDGVSQGPLTSYTFTSVWVQHTITASFAVDRFYITASAGPGGSISPEGAIPVSCGSSRTFLIAPSYCYRIVDVVVDGVSLGPLNYYQFTNVQANHSITASFAASGPYTITASAGPHGTISPSGDVVVSCGASQTFTIVPEACAQIVDVVVDGVSQGVRASYTFTSVKADHSIVASFVAMPTFTITASAGTGGSISPSGAVAVPCGADQTFTITPAACHHVRDVVVDGSSKGPVASYTFAGVTAAHTIAATFAENGDILVQVAPCPQDQGAPQVFGILEPNATYWVDVRQILCELPLAGSALTHSGSVTTDGTGQIVETSLGCYAVGPYRLVIDAVPNGVYDPGCDPVACFKVSVVDAIAGVEDVEATIAPDGPTLSWRVNDPYLGFRIHRAPEGGAEALVTPEPLRLQAADLPAQMRWRDSEARSGTRYAYRIEALKSVGADWYGPVTLAVPMVPKELALRGATPNPFRGTTRLVLGVPFGAGTIGLEVFDVAGRRVCDLYRGTLTPGEDHVTWTGRDDGGAPLRGGMYLVRVKSRLGTRVVRVVKLD